MEPVTVLTAGAIAKIAFEEFVKAGGGELAKKSVAGAIDLVKALRDKIRDKLKGNAKAETAIAAVETEHSEAALTKLEVYLDDAMTDDPEFATQIRQVAQEIQNLTISRQTMASNIKAEGDLKADSMTQRATSGDVRSQEMLTNVEAGNIDLGNLTQES